MLVSLAAFGIGGGLFALIGFLLRWTSSLGIFNPFQQSWLALIGFLISYLGILCLGQIKLLFGPVSSKKLIWLFALTIAVVSITLEIGFFLLSSGWGRYPSNQWLAGSFLIAVTFMPTLIIGLGYFIFQKNTLRMS